MMWHKRWFRRAPTPLLGLDVDADALKLVELAQNASGSLQVLHCAQTPLEPGWLEVGQLVQFDEVAQALRRLLRQSGTHTRKVAMALPTAAVVSKTVSVPAGLSDADLAAHVQSQAGPFFASASQAICLDFGLRGPSTGSPESVDVWMVAARQDTVSDWQGLAEAAGLCPVVLDVQTCAAQRALGHATQWALRDAAQQPPPPAPAPALSPPPLMAWVTVGAQTLGLQVMHNDDWLYAREQRLGGDSERIQAHDLAQAIDHALQGFFTSTTHPHIDGLVLSGQGAITPDLAQTVAQQTGVPCQVANPFVGMSVAPTLSESAVRQDAPAYVVAVGLALRRFDA